MPRFLLFYEKMKINIFLNIKNQPYGGGNQFLKALRGYFISKNVYSESVENADIVLFNSHHQFKELLEAKKKFPSKKFVHRIDGPVFLIRNDTVLLDKIIYQLNNHIADATIFQSKWSRNQNYKLGLTKNRLETTIINAPNPQIFNSEQKTGFEQSRKTKIIATSWSHNLIKGFETYKWLDENLDFTKNEMTFCGNSPIKFQNIQHIPPLKSEELANELKKHDIFITASQKDPCSNSLIEALHCGLPAIGFNDGGHPEIIKDAGEVFNKKEEIPEMLHKITENYSHYKQKIKLPTMKMVGKEYFNFLKQINETQNSKKLFATNMLNIKFTNIKYKIVSRISK